MTEQRQHEDSTQAGPSRALSNHENSSIQSKRLSLVSSKQLSAQNHSPLGDKENQPDLDELASDDGGGNVQSNKQLVEAKQIAFFNDDAVDGISPSMSITNKGVEDFLDDARSFECQDLIPEADVADFALDCELNDQNVKLRGAGQTDSNDEDNKNCGSKQDEDDDNQSQQFSIDDVTDDGDEEQVCQDEPSSQTQSLKAFNENKVDRTCEGKTKVSEAQQLATNDSTTHRYSSSSNNNVASDTAPQPRGSKMMMSPRHDILRPQPIETKEIQANTQESTINSKVDSSLRVSQKKTPHLDREDLGKANIQRFLAHIETKEAPKHHDVRKQQKSQRTLSQSDSQSAQSKSEDSDMNKDNEDPNAPALHVEEQFDAKELKQRYDGWAFFKKLKISAVPIKRYQYMVDQDYKRNKVTVCAHLQNIFNSYCVRRGKIPSSQTNYFDLEKLQNKLNPNHAKESSPAKELRRNNTLATMAGNGEEPKEKENYLLTKSNSTLHIPDNVRNKYSKRVYQNFDKELAGRMFGYRVIFKKRNMEIAAPDPDASQAHKPLAKWTNDILNEVTQTYRQINKYHTRQRILVPMPDSDDDSTDQQKDDPEDEDKKSVNQSDQNTVAVTSSNQDQEGIKEVVKKKKPPQKFVGEIVVLKNKHGEKQNFLKKARTLFWPCTPIERQQSATQSKRVAYAARSSAYGSQLFPQCNGSPARNPSNSPKKPIGWNNVQTHKTPQTQMQMIKHLSQVRYQVPKQGVSNNPNNRGHGTTSQNQHYYRRQNSYRRGLKGRVDSAKGGRSNFRSSAENTGNSAYRMINQEHQMSSIARQDSEVAHITGQDDSNIVHLKDPKHIEGFGSNVVHVNVSCGQTVPDAKAKDQAAKDAAAKPQETEDDDAQTFIIQLSEEQTKQLAAGSLRLNGVLIPKDLSNLNYDQIMALLDSVNLNKEKEKAAKSGKVPSTQTKEPLTNAACQLNEQKYDGYRKQANALPGTMGMNATGYSLAQAKKYSGPMINAKTANNQYMGQTYSGLNNPAHMYANSNLLKLQQTQYTQDRSLASQLDTSAMTNLNMNAGLQMKKRTGRELVKGRQGQSNAPQKSRVESASRQARAARAQKPSEALVAISGKRSQNNSTLAKKVTDQVQPNFTRNNGPTANNSDWEMLTILNSQQNQLKNGAAGPAFIKNPQQSYEHGRKAHLDGSIIEKGKLPNGQVSQSSKQEGFQRATLGQITGTTAQNIYQSTGQVHPFSSDPNQPVMPTAYARHSMVSANSSSSQQMIATVQGGSHPSNNGGYNFNQRVQQAQQQSSTQNASQKQKSLTRLSSKKRIQDRKVTNDTVNSVGLKNDSSRSYIKNTNQSARVSNSLHGLASNQNQQAKINSASLYNQNVGKGNQTPILFNNPKGIISQEQAAQIYNQQKQFAIQQSNSAGNQRQSSKDPKLGNPHNRQNTTNYYQSTPGSGGSASMHITHSQVPMVHQHQIHSNTPQNNTKSLNAKNQLTQYDNQAHPSHLVSRMNGNGQQSKKALVAGKNNTLSVERGSGAVTQYYARTGEQDTAQKLRINQNTLTNMNYANQSSTHQRKIESALAQSAINAIQNKSSVHNSIQMAGSSGKGQFLQFEQKAFSYPKNDINSQSAAKQPYLNQPGAAAMSNTSYIVKSSDYRKPGPPQFVMRDSANNSDYLAGGAGKQQPGSTGPPAGSIKSTTGFKFIQQHVISSKQSPAQQQANTNGLLKTGSAAVQGTGGSKIGSGPVAAHAGKQQ